MGGIKFIRRDKMSEYIIGDRIEPSAQPYTLTEREFTEAVGVRVYGTESGTGEEAEGGLYSVAFSPSDTRGWLGQGFLIVGDAPIYTGYVDVYETVISLDDPTMTYSVRQALSDASVDPNMPALNITKLTNHDTYPFSFIYEGGTHMTTITDRIATIEVDGSETVKFAVSHDVYGVYGEDIIASLKEGAEAGDEGAYSTAGTGKAIIAHYTGADTLYLTGSGTVTVWAGQSPLDDPFAV
jgi:hypothetical protein